MYIQLNSDRKSNYMRILGFLRTKITQANDVVEQNTDNWDEADRFMDCYIDPDALSRKEKEDKDNDIPTFTPITVGITHASVMSALAYQLAVLTQRYPIIPISGAKPEDVESSMVMGDVIQYQIQKSGGIVPFFHYLRDMLVYGVGVVQTEWVNEYKNKIVNRKINPFIEGVMNALGVNKPIKTVENVLAYQGNKIKNVNVYGFLPDPYVSLGDFQGGNFCGVQERISYVNLVQNKKEWNLFNLDDIGRFQIDWGKKDFHGHNGRIMNTVSDEDRGFPYIEKVYIDILPSEWKLGGGRDYERWEFWIANKSVIIKAEKYNSLSGDFPFTIATYPNDWFKSETVGLPYYTTGLEYIINWLFNSHMDAVKDLMENFIVYDPSRIVSKDLLDKGFGKRVRLASDAYGTPIGDVIKQFNLVDPTAGNLRDIDVAINLFQRVTGVTDSIMGVPHIGRRTATESRGIQEMSATRMRLLSEYVHSQGIASLGKLMVENTQRFMDAKQFYHIVGNKAIGAQDKIIEVAPEDILGDYDFPVPEGAVPMDRESMAETWKEVLGMVSTSQFLAQKFDVDKIFERMVSYLGVKDIKDFVIPTGMNVMPNEGLQNQVDKGNLVRAPNTALGNMLGGYSGKR